jgi:cardiolipin synthase
LPITPHEDIYNVPNLLSFSRLLASPVIGYLVLHEQHTAALGLFAAAGLTDLVDGYLARKWKLQTVVGSVIDPMADKALMTVLTVTLAVKGLLPGLFSTRSLCCLHDFLLPFMALLTEVRRFVLP